ncbi:MAG: hypothetical protein M3440_06080, partial [Chloroflexota bacterium]|nr:hypothetical protein [Chloroflexota bacterium]
MPSNVGILPLPQISRRRTVALGGAAALAPFTLRSHQTLAQENESSAAVFPDNRVLLYYGFPENENMGILGEYGPDELLERLYEQAAAYEAADPSRPVKVGFELIASVAQASPQEDGSYIADTDKEWLDT